MILTNVKIFSELIYGPSFDKKSDVFSFGITLFEMLYMREHPDISFAHHDSLGYDMLREPLMKNREPVLPCWWPELFSGLITECLSNNPQKRPNFEKILEIFDILVVRSTIC